MKIPLLPYKVRKRSVTMVTTIIMLNSSPPKVVNLLDNKRAMCHHHFITFINGCKRMNLLKRVKQGSSHFNLSMYTTNNRMKRGDSDFNSGVNPQRDQILICVKLGALLNIHNYIGTITRALLGRCQMCISMAPWCMAYIDIVTYLYY